MQPQQTMHLQLQENVGFYGRTLESTGGALAWEKCKAYLLMFVWINGVKIILQNKNDFPPLKVFSLLTGIYHFIKLANPDEAFCMLGAFVAPNGSTETQIKILKQIVKRWADNISKSYLTPHESLIAFKQVLFPAVVYPVAVMPITKKDCADIMKPAIKALLQKLNMPITTNRELTPSDRDRMRRGITDKGEFLMCDHIKKTGKNRYHLVLHTGKNREIRRMVSFLGKKVTSLIRVSYGGIKLGDIREGSVIPLNSREMRRIFGD